jgi:hypothetical protein
MRWGLNQLSRCPRQGMCLGLQHGTAATLDVLSSCTRPVQKRANVLTDVGLDPQQVLAVTSLRIQSQIASSAL